MLICYQTLDLHIVFSELCQPSQVICPVVNYSRNLNGTLYKSLTKAGFSTVVSTVKNYIDSLLICKFATIYYIYVKFCPSNYGQAMKLFLWCGNRISEATVFSQPGVHLKPALNRGRRLFIKCNFRNFFQIDLLSPILPDQGQFVNAEPTFPLVPPRQTVPESEDDYYQK